jgi:hypothetical protein
MLMQSTEHTTGCRYDHYATLCELLPVGLPSLRCCLAVLANKGKTTLKISHLCEIVSAVSGMKKRCRLKDCHFCTSEKDGNYTE